MKSLTWYICLNSLHFSSIEVFLYTCQLNVKSIHTVTYQNTQIHNGVTKIQLNTHAVVVWYHMLGGVQWRENTVLSCGCN